MIFDKYKMTAPPTFNIVKTAIPCLICGEDIICEGIAYTPMICDKCKAAVMKVRKESED